MIWRAGGAASWSARQQGGFGEMRLTGDDRHLARTPLAHRLARHQSLPTGAGGGPPPLGRLPPQSPRATTPDGIRPIDAGKRNVLGVLVDAIEYDAAIAKIMDAARWGRPLSLTALAVHGVMTGVHDPVYNARLRAIDLVAPDGQPVRWALNL